MLPKAPPTLGIDTTARRERAAVDHGRAAVGVEAGEGQETGAGLGQAAAETDQRRGPGYGLAVGVDVVVLVGGGAEAAGIVVLIHRGVLQISASEDDASPDWRPWTLPSGPFVPADSGTPRLSVPAPRMVTPV